MCDDEAHYGQRVMCARDGHYTLNSNEHRNSLHFDSDTECEGH